MKLFKKLSFVSISSIALSIVLAAPAFAQIIVFNGQESYKPNAINSFGRFFLSVDDLNYLFQDIYGLDVNEYYMFFDVLEPPSMDINGVTFVPVRAFSEGLGWEVDWINSQVIINFPDDYIIFDELSTYDQSQILDILQNQISNNPGITGGLHRVTYGDNIAYIFGSFHAGLSHWFPLADVVENAMASADVFAFEANLFEPSMQEIERATQILEEFMTLPDGQTISDILDEELYRQFVYAIESFNLIDYAAFYNLNPIVLMNEITTAYIVPLMGLEWEYSVDNYVAMMAMVSGRPIIGLVPMYDEIESLFDIPMDVLIEQVQSFGNRDQVLEGLEKEIDLTQGLIYAYENNDIEMLRAIMAYAFFLYDATTPAQLHTSNVINFARSIRFAQSIERLLQETTEPTTFFITVGISHVVRGGTGIDNDGITNVIEYLKNSGFNTEALY